MDDQGQKPNPFAGGRWDPPPAPVALETPELNRHVDRGGRSTALIAWIATVALVLTTFALQQISAASPKEAAPSTGVTPPPADDTEAMSLKLVVKMSHFLDRLSQQGSAGAPPGGSQLVESVDSPTHSAPNALRAAIAAGEIAGDAEAASRLEEFIADLEDNSADRKWKKLPDEDRAVLLQDARVLLEQYGAGATLTPPVEDELIKRHGYFGRLAATHDKPDTDPERAGLLGGGGKLIALLGGFGGLVALVILGGLAAFIIMTVLLFSGRLRARFVPPLPGGSVYLETVALFFLGFLLVQAVITLVVSNRWVSEGNALFVAMGAQWCLVPVVLWPVVRGTPFSRWRRDMGLHAGEGFFTELGAGLAGYLAGIPLLLVAMVVSLVAAMIKQGMSNAEEGPAVENPVVELVTKGGIAPWLLFALGTIWAPLVEECVFRGAMYRHLRGSLSVLLSAVIVALAFGSAHGYEWMMLGPVIALGFNFSLMRQWRGSLIGPIAAHALHNATVLLMVITLFTLLKD